jgi:hypothetical protein
VVEEILESVLATERRQRRLRSKTFWRLFGFKKRSEDRVEIIRSLISGKGLVASPTLGEEGWEEWITLSYVESPRPPVQPSSQPQVPVRYPDDTWFAGMASRAFESEREVEIWFVLPLLEQLGFREENLAYGFPVEMFEGVRKVKKEADCVVFSGEERGVEHALLIVEAKGPRIPALEDAVGQARAYAIWLSTPYYLVTNGDQIKLFLFRGAVQPDVNLLTCRRAELKQHWPTIYAHLNRDALLEYKTRLVKGAP